MEYKKYTKSEFLKILKEDGILFENLIIMFFISSKDISSIFSLTCFINSFLSIDSPILF